MKKLSYEIKKVAVLGSGVMGSQIAAHLANVGIPSYLLDIVPKELTEEEKQKGLTLESPEVRNRFGRIGIEGLKNSKPAPCFIPEVIDLITIGNFEDNMNWLKEVDWIIEVVVENLEIKRNLMKKVDEYRKPGTIVSSNTSGISISRICEGLSEDFRKHFLGTHFFNPPRYLKLLEIIPTKETLPEVIKFMANFGERVLGKGIVYCKDTPNFIANRIGIFSIMYAIKVMIEDGYTIDELDRIGGPALGRPKSAYFRTADLVGLDTLIHVARNIYDNVPNDPKRDVFIPPDFIQKMISNKWLGEKSGQGFYKKVKVEGKSEILTLDYNTMEYVPKQKVKFPSLDIAKNILEIGERIKSIIKSKDRAGIFVWKTLSETLLYTASVIPEISDDIYNIDNAIKWGFGWEIGPFEIWDAIGVEKSVEKMKEEGKYIPEIVQKLLNSSKKTFYQKDNGKLYFFDLKTEDYKPVLETPDVIILSSLKEQNKVIKKTPGASLIDIGDGVLCLEFHSKMNAIGADTIQMLNYAVKETEEKGYEGLVIGNQGKNFSVGANIMLILLEAMEQNWEELDMVVRSFQNANMRLKYSSKPVVVAPFGMTLGGGCEVTLHGNKVRASAETYIGLVEVGVGVIPAGGGTKEMLIRSLENIPPNTDIDLFPFVRRAFETIGMARVATSAEEAKKLGFLRPTDGISVNQDRLITDAKLTVLSMAKEGFKPLKPKTDIPALGQSAFSTLKLGLYMMKEGGYISEYDMYIGTKLAYILCGGDCITPQKVSEQYILDLEREAFLSLLGQKKTLERIQHMLKTNKPLRN